MSNNDHTPSWIQEAENTVTTHGTEAGAAGLTTHGNDQALMLNVRPAAGSGRLIPYSRIEEVEVNDAATVINIYASHCIVTIRGRELEAVITALQRAVAWSLHVGQSTSNEVKIDDITITLASDSGD